MQITPATIQDESGIKALLQACQLPSDDLSTSHFEHFFVIKDSGVICGSVGLELCEKYGLLRSLALKENLRGGGLGTQLVQHIEAHARLQQTKAIYLLTTTADSFFTRLGYQIIPRENAPAPVKSTAEFQNICPASAVCMFKEL